MRPVLLFDMGVVVLLVRATPGKSDVPPVTVADHLTVDELGAVVGVDRLDLKRQFFSHLVKGLADPRRPFPQDCLCFHPGGADIRQVEGVGKKPLGALPAVGDGVELEETRCLDIPVFTFNRNLVPQKSPRLGPPIDPPPELPLLARKRPVDGPGTDPQKQRLLSCGQRVAFPDPRLPEPQDRFQPHRPGITRLLPDLLDNPHQVRTIQSFPFPANSPLRLPAFLELADPRNGVLAMIAGGLAELV